MQRNGATLIVAILGARDLWGDTKRLLEYGFDHYDMLKGHPQGGKTATNEQQVRMRFDRASALMVNPQEANQPKPGEGFVLQLGAFRDRDRAEVLARQIAERGFLTCLSEQTAINRSEAAYRVRWALPRFNRCPGNRSANLYSERTPRADRAVSDNWTGR